MKKLKSVGAGCYGCLFENDPPFSEQVDHLLTIVQHDLENAKRFSRRQKELTIIEDYLCRIQDCLGLFED